MSSEGMATHNQLPDSPAIFERRAAGTFALPSIVLGVELQSVEAATPPVSRPVAEYVPLPDELQNPEPWRRGGLSQEQITGGKQPFLTSHRLLFAAHWAAAQGRDPSSFDAIREAISGRVPTSRIMSVLERHFEGSFDVLAANVSHRTMNWPQSLLNGAEAWPPRAKSSYLPIVPFSEATARYSLPPTWGEVCEWYHDTLPLTFRLAEAASPDLVTDGDAPLGDWAEYWHEIALPYGAKSLVKPKGVLVDRIIDLEGVPHIDDIADLEAALTGQPYLCVVGDRDIRNGSEEPGAVTILTKVEKAILNLLMLFELRGCRSISVEQLSRRSGIAENKVRRCLPTFVDKVNNPRTARTIIRTQRDHWRLSPETVLVDARTPEELPEGTDYRPVTD